MRRPALHAAPLPLAVALAIINAVARRGYLRVGRGMFIGILLYLRPGELVALLADQFTRPPLGGMKRSGWPIHSEMVMCQALLSSRSTCKEFVQ